MQQDPSAARCAPSGEKSPGAGAFGAGAGQSAYLAGQALSRPSGPQVAWIILAAGLGTRMKSSTPKVLQPLCGRPLGWFSLRTATALTQWQVVMVTGHQAARVEQELSAWAARLGVTVDYVRQEPQLGTGHAVSCALPALAPTVEEVVVSYADVPLLSAATLQQLVHRRRESGAALAMVTSTLSDPTGYGRVVRAGGRPDGPVTRVVEERDATPAEHAIREVNTGIYCFRRDALSRVLGQLKADNAQGEYYLTDTVGLLRQGGEAVVALAVEDPLEVQGVNDLRELKRLEAHLRHAARDRLTAGGVAFVGEPPGEVDPWAAVEPDCTIHSGASVGGESRLARGCVLGPGARLVDCVLEEGVTVVGVALTNCHIGSGALVGPGVWVPPGARIAPRARIGDVGTAAALRRGGDR